MEEKEGRLIVEKKKAYRGSTRMEPFILKT